MPDHNTLVLTPAERRAELAAILAAGFLRLGARVHARQETSKTRERFTGPLHQWSQRQKALAAWAAWDRHHFWRSHRRSSGTGAFPGLHYSRRLFAEVAGVTEAITPDRFTPVGDPTVCRSDFLP